MHGSGITKVSCFSALIRLIHSYYGSFWKPLIMHHGRAAEVLLVDPKVPHMCEYMLLIDKVKDPKSMLELHHRTVETGRQLVYRLCMLVGVHC